MDSKFTKFKHSIEGISLPNRFTSPFNPEPHALARIAAKQLQEHISIQNEWVHNFGLDKSMDGPQIGKMFGVLVVQNESGELGFLSAFSGKMAGGNQHSKFVPPIFDGSVRGGFLSLGMDELERKSIEIEQLMNSSSQLDNERVPKLKDARKKYSVQLQKKLFEQYHFVNQKGISQSLNSIFSEKLEKKPPSGAGECAAPKLLQYAFSNKLTPIAIAEFWWGQTSKLVHRKHLEYYPACKEKCEPILSFMLSETKMTD